MKQMFCISTIIVITILFASCGREDSEIARLQAELDALRGEINTPAPVLLLPTTTPTPAPTPVPTINPTPVPTPELTPEPGVWTIRYYVDQFNQPTDENYIVNDEAFVGVFSNSATTNSTLLVLILVDDDIAIVLFEYGRNRVNNSSSRNSQSYDIVMRTPDDIRHNISGSIHPNCNRIFIDGKYRSTVLRALQGTGNIDFYIEQTDRRTTNYLFSVPTSNFAETYEIFD
jgi:hypothetical protein